MAQVKGKKLEVNSVAFVGARRAIPQRRKTK